MRCPACQAALVVVEREGIELDWCVECGGLWFDEGEMELLGEKAGRQLEAEDLGRWAGNASEIGERRCPRCPRRMERLTLPPRETSGDATPIEIDRCPDHGVWLDRGELGRIMRRLAPRPTTSRRSDTDEGLMMSFLGETFVATADAPAAPPERREE